MSLIPKNKGTSCGSEGSALLIIFFLFLLITSLIAIGFNVYGPNVQRGKVFATVDSLNGAVDAIIGWSAGNRKLPDTTNFATVVRDPNDSYGAPLYYLYDSNLAATPVVGSDAADFCSRSTTNLTVYFCPDAVCATPTTTIPNVAFIVLSGGPNHNNQTAGTQGVSASATINVFDASVSIDKYPTDVNRIEPYDDIVRIVTLNELKSRARCAGYTRGRLAILNNELPRACQNKSYTAVIYPDGGVPQTGTGNYNWCVQGSIPTGINATPYKDCSQGWSSGYTTLQLSGIPTATGSAFTVKVQDYDNISKPNTSGRLLSLNVLDCSTGLPAGSGSGSGSGFSPFSWLSKFNIQTSTLLAPPPPSGGGGPGGINTESPPSTGGGGPPITRTPKSCRTT